MIIFPENEPRWSLEARDALSTFLSSAEGKLFLEMLAWLRPRYGDTTNRLVESGRIEGYEDCVCEIIDLARRAQKTSSEKILSSYPALDDDSAWADFDNKQ